MTRLKAYTTIVVLIASSAIAFAQPAPAPAAAPPARPIPTTNPEALKAFDALVQKVQRDSGGATPADVELLFKTAKEVGRPIAAHQAAKNYLTKNLTPPPTLLLLAADNARDAADYRTAVSRYKAYLKSAQPSPEASDAAASLYTVLLDFLGTSDDAYDSMNRFGDKFRQTLAAKKFDQTYLDMAAARQNYAGVANRLALVMADKLPLELERTLYWETLDWEFAWLTRGTPDQFAALDACKQIIPLIRENKARQLRFTYITATLEFRASLAGKDAAAIVKDYEPIIAAQRAYFDAYPTYDTLADIINTNFGGYQIADATPWNRNQKQNQDFFAYAFPKLSDKEKPAMINYRGWWTYLASSETWTNWALQNPAIFKASPQTSYINFAWKTNDPAYFKQQATFLQDIQTNTTAPILALAAGGNDFWAGVQWIIQNDAWRHNSTDLHTIVWAQMWPWFTTYTRDPANALPPDAGTKLYMRFADEILTKSPVIYFDPVAAQSYVASVWTAGGADKSQVPALLHVMDWIPYGEVERKAVFSPTYAEFKKWTEAIRTAVAAGQKAVDDGQKAVEAAKKLVDEATKARDAAAAADKPAKEADLVAKAADLTAKEAALAAADAALKPQLASVPQITPIEDAFKPLLDGSKVDPAKAPTPLCQKIALATLAIRAKNEAEFKKLAREIYPLIQNYDIKKIPYGTMVMSFLAANRLDTFDTFDVQCEMLASELAAYVPGQSAAAAAQVWSNIWSGRPGWNWAAAPVADAPRMKILNNIVAKAERDLLAKNQFAGFLIEWWRYSRRGTGWADTDLNTDIIASMIEKKVLLTSDYRIGHGGSPAMSYMWLIRNEAPSLEAKYPASSYFDKMYADEITARGMIDNVFWAYSNDPTGVVGPLLAKFMGDCATVPFGYQEGNKIVYSRAEFYELNNRLLTLPKATRDPAIAKIEATYGKTRFDQFAMGRGYFTTEANASTPEGRKAYFDKLTAFLDATRNTPGRWPPPPMNALTQVDPKSLTDNELQILLSIFPSCTGSWPGGWYFETLATTLHQALVNRHRESELYAVVPFFWRIARDTNNVPLQRTLSQYARELVIAKQFEVAAAYADAGNAVYGTDMVDDVRSNLTSVRTKAMADTGNMIPVEPSDPRYGIFVSQANWASGKLQAAWDTYLDRRDIVLTAFKDLDPTYIIWLIGRNTEARSFDMAESLSRQMMTWVDAAPESFEPEMRAGLLLTYADIAFARQEYPRARAQFERIAAANEFETTRAKRDAELRIAEVDRVTKQYDKAIDRLEKLLHRNDKYLQTESYYEMALIKFDQTLYPESNEALEQVFSRVPDHANARILQGKLQLMMKKLSEATDVPVGLTSSQRFVVPGKPLKVDLEDRNLAIVGASTNVEIRVWTSGGDEEFFNLFPFGDSKTKFQSQISTELGTPKKGDHILQLSGNDVVSYDYSDKFAGRTKAHGDAVGVSGAPTSDSAPNTLTVVTDAQLFVSSGKILTKEELDERALERLIRQRLRLDESLDKRLALDTVRAEDQIKPGNKINVRVIDPDQSISPDKNTVFVSVATSSGDLISQFPLVETGVHTGVFEGGVPTSSGQATAYASDSEEGHEPNFTISASEYPAWVGLPDNNRPKALSVDLNDSVALGKLNVLANIPGRKLKDFFVQTSVNGRDFVTVGRWPTVFEPWDGSLHVDFIKWYPKGNPPVTVDEFRKYLGETYMTRGMTKITAKLPSLTQRWDANILGNAPAMTMGVLSDWFVADMYGAFYVPKNQVRTFKLDHKGNLTNIRYLVTIDGKPGDDPYVVSRSLSKGVHRLDVYVMAYRHNNPVFEVQTDSPNPPFMIPCPPEMFDPAKEPEIAKAMLVKTAKVTAAADSSSFDIEFAAETKSRAVRLLIADFETDAPAVSKIKLTNAAGQAILPTQQDFQQLKRNEVLEIVPGDRISVTYKDPKAITKEREIQEAFMTATFSNADISAAFVEFELDRRGNRVPIYIPMRRFKPGDAVKVFVRDADADVTEKLDTVKFKVKGSDGKTIEMDALETEEHSGVFMGTIAPVTVAPTKPTEVQVKEGEDVILSYFDKENTDPGIPWERTYSVEQAVNQKPEIRAYDVATRPLTPDEMKNVAVTDVRGRHFEEHIDVTRSIVATRPQTPPDDKNPGTILVDGPLLVELLSPSIAQAPNSQAIIYLQTSSGRKKYGKPLEGDFDINVPGTIHLRRAPRRSWVFTRLSEELTRSRWSGLPPWDALHTLAEELGLPELDDFADIMRLSGEEGASVYGNLRARSAAMRTAMLNDEIAEANAVGERMTIPGSLLGVIFMALLVAPSLLRMFSNT